MPRLRVVGFRVPAGVWIVWRLRPLPLFPLTAPANPLIPLPQLFGDAVELRLDHHGLRRPVGGHSLRSCLRHLAPPFVSASKALLILFMDSTSPRDLGD